MDERTFAAALTATAEPAREELLRRFDEAFARTKDVHTAMAVVNEHLDVPLTYEALLGHEERAA